MANKFIGEVAVEFEGCTYTLRMDMNALCHFEDLTGTSAMEAIQHIEQGNLSNIKMLRALVFASLMENHPDATEQLAGRILSSDLELLMRVIEAATPEMPTQPGGSQKGKRKQQ